MGGRPRVTSDGEVVNRYRATDMRDAAGHRQSDLGQSDLVGVGKVRLIEFPRAEESRGSLVVGEFASLPFMPRRFFSVYGVPPGSVRGEHAHYECEQLLVALHGSVRCTVDDGANRREIVLDSPSAALYVPARIWGIQDDFTADAALLVLASLPYDSGDYVNSYDDFVQLVRPQG